MKALFIQLSDIHIKSDGNPIFSKKEKLLEAVQNEAKSIDEVFLLITGDTAFSGSVEEFKISTSLFNEFVENLSKYSEKKINTIILPGNHDCQNLKEENKAREGLIRLIQDNGSEAVDQNVIEVLTGLQSNYFDFAKGLNHNAKAIYENQLLNAYRYEIEGKSIVFYIYNTSYQSILHEQPGKMLFPVSLFDEQIFKERADLIISCFHHPLHWLKPENRREFKFHIENTSDFYFTGHEHQATKSLISDLDDNLVYYIEGDVLQDNNDPNVSGFNIVYFDLNENKFQITNYKWNGNRFKNATQEPKWISYQRGTPKIKSPYELKTTFKESLNDIGANLSHPNVAQVKLSDLFIYPRLELLDYSSSADKEVSISTEDSESLINSLKGNIRLLLSGTENIGKTSLLKSTFRNLHARGFVPVLIDGHKIRSAAIDDFRKTVTSHFLNEYESSDKEDIIQLSTAKLVLIIDDFDKVSLNSKYKGKLIANLIGNYENIIISGNELMSLEDIVTDETVNEDLFSSFHSYEIREFGNLLRSKLINKWITLGATETITDEERIKKLHQAELIIRTVIGKNLVPSYPLFLLTILQAIELGNPVDLTASTFGHYYQFLIQKAFGNSLKSQDEITSYNNYLSELAYYFFRNRVRCIDAKEMQRFDADYRVDFTIKDSLETILRNLVNANILEDFEGCYEFKYLYIYYFFVSKHFAENIEQDDIKETISALCKRLHKSEFANILLFLTHHSKDKFLLNEILINAKNLFNNLEACKLENDIPAINRLGEKLPKIVYSSKTVDEHRDEVNTKKDEIEAGERDELTKELSVIPDLNEDISDLDIVAKLNLAFKTIEILGQILKNNYGKISNPVIFDLVEETYLMGLRTLNVFFSVIETNTDYLVNQINDIVSEKHITDKRKIEQVSRRILFNICNQISYSFIKKVTDSVGTENLENSYKGVLEKHNFNSVKLIDFSIKLDHFKSFPNKEMRDLKVSFSKFPLVQQIMKRMVINYLYLFPTSQEQKQRILSFLEIPMNVQRRIDFTSTHNRK
jgi:hypothetical protein